MRRSLALLVPFIPSLLLAGCEDGPTQTFSPAPNNAGNIWNNGNTPAAVDDAGQPLVTNNSGGTSKTEICNGAELQDQWARMVAQPIVPPYLIAGVDLSGINYQSLTVEQAENGVNGKLFPAPGAPNPPTRLCQGTPQGGGGNGGDCGGGGGSLVTTWGNNSEFLMEWCVNTHKDLFNTINPGYVGTMEWDYTCEKGACIDPTDVSKHHYVWQIGKPITRTDSTGKAVTFNLDWNGYGTPPKAFYIEADELYRGLTKTFTPELYDDLPGGVLCQATGRCPAFPTGNSGVYPILGFRTLSMYWEMDPPTISKISGDTPHDAYFFNIKYAPYSAAVANLKMDAVGPTASLTPIGNLTPPADCELSLGGTFLNLKKNCINVFSDQNVNATALAKVLGNLAHDDNDFTFSVVGINQNYRPPELDIGGKRQFDIIHDGELPQDNAVASDYTYDVRANGPILQDRFPTNTVGVYGRDNHGAGAVWREFQRTTQQDLAAKLAAKYSQPAKTLHDWSCLMPLSCQGGATCAGDTTFDACINDAAGCAWTYPPGFNANTWRPAKGCTGMEGFITNAYPNTNAQTGIPVNVADATVIDPNNVWDVGGDPFRIGGNNATYANYVITNGLRPGTPWAMYCFDPPLMNYCGPGWNGPLQGQYGALLDSSVASVLQVAGDGDPLNLPPGTGDYRYFFQYWTRAMASYFGSGAALHTGQLAPNAATGTKNDPVPYFGPPDARCPAGNCGPNQYILNTDDMFFDSFGGNANKGEFIVYDNADNANDPLDLNLQILLIGTNLQDVHFYKRLDREERAMYMAMGNADAKVAKQASWGLLKDNTGKIIKDEFGVPRKNAAVWLSNIAGAPAVTGALQVANGRGTWQNAYSAPGTIIPQPAGSYDPCNPSGTPMKDAHYCASHQDQDCGNFAIYGDAGNGPPVDAAGNVILRPNGDPLFYGYCGIWHPTPFHIGSTSIKLINTDITPEVQVLEQEAEVEIPNFANPYDASSASTPIHVLVPWLPQQDGVGYSVPTTGQQDVFVETAQLDFAGQVITPLMDYLPQTETNDAGQTSTAARIVAWESQDFLGDAFVCYDTASGGVNFAIANSTGVPTPGDILVARMYTPVQDILTWIANHPTAQDQCQLIIRYSPYNNYPDYITAVANGVKLAIDQGEGAGRVIDVTLFEPGTGNVANP